VAGSSQTGGRYRHKLLNICSQTDHTERSEPRVRPNVIYGEYKPIEPVRRIGDLDFTIFLHALLFWGLLIIGVSPAPPRLGRADTESSSMLPPRSPPVYPPRWSPAARVVFPPGVGSP